MKRKLLLGLAASIAALLTVTFLVAGVGAFLNSDRLTTNRPKSTGLTVSTGTGEERVSKKTPTPTAQARLNTLKELRHQLDSFVNKANQPKNPKE